MEYIYEFSNLWLFQDESNINNYKIRTMRNETRINSSAISLQYSPFYIQIKQTHKYQLHKIVKIHQKYSSSTLSSENN